MKEELKKAQNKVKIVEKKVPKKGEMYELKRKNKSLLKLCQERKEKRNDLKKVLDKFLSKEDLDLMLKGTPTPRLALISELTTGLVTNSIL